jgi:hypothetical protein
MLSTLGARLFQGFELSNQWTGVLGASTEVVTHLSRTGFVAVDRMMEIIVIYMFQRVSLTFHFDQYL